MRAPELDLELALDRFEAELGPELAAQAAAHQARALVDARASAPPWPAMLGDGRAARLARTASGSGDAGLRARGRTLGRWATAAALAMDPAWREARDGARDLAGLARRYRALEEAAGRMGLAGAGGLVEAVYGVAAAPAEEGAGEGEAAGEGESGEGEGEGAGGAIPTWQEVMGRLVAEQGLQVAGIDVRAGARSLTTVIAPGRVRCVLGPGRDALDALIVATHEIGHGLYAAQQGGLPLGLAVAPARWFDEAVAAWAVRTLERDRGIGREARRRRVRRERLTARLAAFEARVLGGVPVAVAWAEIGPDVRLEPALFEEPGVMASYRAADRARLAPGPGELRDWARAGAAL